MLQAPNGRVFVDNKVVLQNSLTMVDLEKMYDNPERFFLSNYLRNKVIKKRQREFIWFDKSSI
jgi:hypothetical protein